MHGRGGIPSKVTFHQAEESDRLGMARLCENQGWDTEDHQHLASVLLSAVHVARCGAKIVGLYFYIIWSHFVQLCSQSSHYSGTVGRSHYFITFPYLSFQHYSINSQIFKLRYYNQQIPSQVGLQGQGVCGFC